ncbi:hypothetical protein QTH87_25190 [Variovorax sp. J22P168]|uniref:hypothetical protein n=1 Tax=Variovorax jilinensis TaxID=3053513 RepID=UPI0025771E2D|nr:hypothetical protein [Variovorax sp. J22P168]MDM0015759.1 hypothetical protein [Variovorax sp. J22P168]
MVDDAYGDPAGLSDPQRARKEFTALAVAASLIRLGDHLDQKLVDLASEVALECAAIADPYAGLLTSGTAGDQIRRRLGLVRKGAPVPTPLRQVEAQNSVKRLTGLAVAAGVIHIGDELDQNAVDFANNVVDRCASIVEPFWDGEAGSNAAEHIRAELGR